MKNYRYKTVKGFSLLELMISVTIAGIITAFALPNYTASQNRANEKDIINQMKIIHAAQNSVFGRTNSFISSTNTIAELNTALGLNIIANGNTYRMNQLAGGRRYRLTVSRGGGAGLMQIILTDDAWDPKYVGVQGNPSCSAGCPTLK